MKIFLLLDSSISYRAAPLLSIIVVNEVQCWPMGNSMVYHWRIFHVIMSTSREEIHTLALASLSAALWRMFRIKRSLHLHYLVTELLVSSPVGLLAFNWTIIYVTTSSTIEHLAAFYLLPITQATVWMVANSHLRHIFDFLVFLVQAGWSKGCASWNI